MGERRLYGAAAENSTLGQDRDNRGRKLLPVFIASVARRRIPGREAVERIIDGLSAGPTEGDGSASGPAVGGIDR